MVLVFKTATSLVGLFISVTASSKTKFGDHFTAGRSTTAISDSSIPTASPESQKAKYWSSEPVGFKLIIP